jgi:hypothetical protein
MNQNCQHSRPINPIRSLENRACTEHDHHKGRAIPVWTPAFEAMAERARAAYEADKAQDASEATWR